MSTAIHRDAAARVFTGVMVAITVVLAGCADSGPTDSLLGAAVNDAAGLAPDSCATLGQNQFVDQVMRDIYFWVDELPVLDPGEFDSPEALLQALTFDDLDRFSSIRDAAADEAFFSDSQFVGVGLGLVTRGEQLFVTQAFGDGPAAAAGLRRGFEVLEINDRSVPLILAEEGVDAAFGADEIGVQVGLRYADGGGAQFEAMLVKALVTIEPVPAVGMLDAGGVSTGYVAFRDFVDPAFAALDEAFAVLAAEGIGQLVLDLRYNGGGLISVAEFLANLLGGAGTAGQVFSFREHNRLNTGLDITTVFREEAASLDLSRLVVITASGTASASELVINGLAPFVDIALIGDTTFGKPVGQYGYTFCDKVLSPTSFRLSNADGVTDYYDGFAPDCEAPDDLTRALGDPEEASLAEALFYLENGGCSIDAQVRGAERALQKQSTPRRAQPYGFREMLGGAY